MEKVALITGASAGIGTELAKVFAKAGHRVALAARRGERLRALADEIVAAGGHKPVIVAIDLQQVDAADRLAAVLRAESVEVEYLVNNAGFGLMGAAFELDRHEQIAMIDLNVRTLTDLCLCFADQLLRNKGGILNVASLAGFLPGPRMAVYYASKAFVLSLSQALHTELRRKGVRVTTLCPGPVATEFQTRAGTVASADTRIMEVSAREVAEQGFRGLMAGRRLVLPGAGTKVTPFVFRLLPRGLLLRAVDRVQRRRR